MKMSSGPKISDEIWKTWDKHGREQFMKAVAPFIKDEERTPLLSKSGKFTVFSQMLYELIVSGVQGHLKKEIVVATLHDLCLQHSDISSILLDVVCILDAETCAESQSEPRNNFCYIIRETECFLSDKLLKERLEIDTLQDVGTLKNKNFYTKFIKIKTKLYYKQRKFNLFREESEGYAKLIVELNQEMTDQIEWKTIFEIIKSLIGCFNLDPNRVLDIILESFEARTHLESLFIPLIREYMCDANVICEVLGFRLGTADCEEDSKPSPLLTVIALLLQHEVITLDDIYPWLRPDDNVMVRAYERELKSAQDYIRRLNIISTKTPPANGVAEIVEEKEESQDKYSSNQKLVLGTALLHVGCWRVFRALCARLPDGAALAPRPPAQALCNMIHSLIEPIYRRHCSVAPKIVGKKIAPMCATQAPSPAETFEQLKEVVVPALITLGPYLHYDPVLMYKIIRILRTSRMHSGDVLQHEAITVLDAAILPALAHLDGNCCMAEEVYTLIKLYPYQCRYCLYSRWKNDAPERHASLMRRRGAALQRIKAIMKRVSKENIKPQGRLIGKWSHSAPGFLFDYMLLQIQIYDNLIGPVVESLKYLTSLSYDVLGYCLLESLSGAPREGAAVVAVGPGAHPQWLHGLAQFSGAAFKKYNIELTGLLQYVANQLKAQKSQDLLILKEIVQKMAGIEAAEEMTAEQLDAMAGGELLKGEAGYFSQVRNTRRSSARLKDAIAGNNLDISLCLLAAQQRHCCVWTGVEEEANAAVGSQLKLVGRLVDQCQDSLVQLGTFLATAHSPEEYVSRLPTIEEMLRDYHIGADVAFFLYRPVLMQRIASRAESLRRAGASGGASGRWCEASRDSLQPIVTSLVPLLPTRVWEDISPEFYVTFWSLTMYDLKVPSEAYQREIEKVSAAAKEAREGPGGAGAASSNKGKKEQERFNTLIDKLQEEKRKQQEHVERVLERLRRESLSWFPARAAKSAKNETVTRLMQLCLFPRCIFTPADALYCAQFVHTIHALKTPNFSTLLCYDRLFCDITYSVTSCTEGEAARYGSFLCAVLGTAMRWHADNQAFQRECAHYPGFVTKYRVSNQFSEANDQVGYENYRHVCHKWHYKITKAMVVCLDSGDYVQIRNALIVLIRVLPHFPVLEKLSQIIERKIDKVREEEKSQRQDLYVLATSYSGQLHGRNKAGSMMRETDFHQVGEKIQNANLSTTNGQVVQDNPENGINSATISPAPEGDRDRKERSTGGAGVGAMDKKSGGGGGGSATPQEREAKRDQQSRSDRDRVKEEVRRKDKSPREPREPRERSYREERYLEVVSTPAAELPPAMAPVLPGTHATTTPGEGDSERDMKRRKLESSSKGSKDGDERSPEKEKRKASKPRTEDRKERKMSRKRDRLADETLLIEQKRRRDEQKVNKMGIHQNGGLDEQHHFDKYLHKREKSPPYRDRSHEHQEPRDKHRRSETKLRR